ncbi:gamma-tubulin complex component 6 [Chelonus insularis]|uniref:gamma-tubulin complex component 6 n=1 Tax=Chelonus insularis TaxID=460826 RepID=UPI00158B4A7B|nr:gamma-tubulin complex component 6 [Chelonus insularis]XP_034936755.1 gamma-tubulin complex component 6 [Chelonus insularis]
MDFNPEKTGFFDLITHLCKSLLEKNPKINNSRRNNSDKMINKMRTLAFQILLKKHHEILDFEDNCNTEEVDPIVDLLKYSFVLKTTFGCSSISTKLENLLNGLLDNLDEIHFIMPVLYFLSCLKNYQRQEQDSLNIFYYGKHNPALPEVIENENEVPQYQIYPTSAFSLSHKINQMTDINNHDFMRVNLEASFGFTFQFQLQITNNEFSMAPYSFQNMNAIGGIENEFYPNHIKSLWHRKEIEYKDVETYDSLSTSNESIESLNNVDDLSQVDNVVTWETMGHPESSKQTHFILESKDAIEHLQFYQNLSIDSMDIRDQELQKIDISVEELKQNIKLALLGIDSGCYVWDDKRGFILKSNVSVRGLSKETLESISSEITHWATCFKLLSRLVKGDSETDKSKKEGLIFKAMRNSIDEIIVHYVAAISQIFNHDNLKELLSLLFRLRKLGILISEVAKLCRCDNVHQIVLTEGTGILSHIYTEVTKKTKPNIALVYYSVLKSCCEAYFQLLEKWIFEGSSDEAYGEFIIKIRSQYLRHRGHKFWTKCFGINNQAVPGFLKNLTDLILQCGKTVKLLKICNPNNPLCNLFLMARPTMKVCLSVQMLSEQEEICQSYIRKGMEILGMNVTISTALQEMKAIEKAKADHVIAIQYETLQRIKKDRQKAQLLIAKNKRELLADQKKQVQDAILRKEKAKEAELLQDKLMLERHLAEEEKIRIDREAEIQVTLDYYKELAAEAKKQRARALWRTKRMKIFDERLSIITLTRQDEINMLFKKEFFNNSVSIIKNNDTNAKPENINLIKFESAIDIANNLIKYEDRNKLNKNDNQKRNNEIKSIDRPTRPTLLPVNKQNTTIESIFNEISENNPTFKNTRTQICYNLNAKSIVEDKTQCTLTNTANINDNNNLNIIILDEKSNRNTIDNEMDNANDQNNQKNTNNAQEEQEAFKSEGDNNEAGNSIDIRQTPNPTGNELNDTTPMSCTTDSYVPSGMSGSAIYNCLENGSLESKNDFETPTTPGDFLNSRNAESRLSGEDYFPRSSSQFFNMMKTNNFNPPAFETSLSKADVAMIDNTSLQVYLEKSVLIPLRVQSHLANSAIVKCLIYDHKMLSHLQSLRCFFFLLNGEFAKNLTGPLYAKFYSISMPDELFNSSALTNLLENALHYSLNSSYTNSELLSLTAIDIPTRLKVLDPEALNCLCLRYKVTWPLNIILDEAVMQQYDKVFKFLLMVGRVMWVLQEDFCILKNQREAALSYQYHRVQLFRHAMMQFMTALSNYLTCSVLHSSWAEFEKDLENAMTIDQIYATHVSYIKKILSRCMLTNRGEKLRICLRNVYQIILKFHNYLRSHDWVSTSKGYVHPNFSKLEKMYEGFCTMRTYPAQVVDRYASSGYQMHLTRFLDALNINPLFSL